MDEITIKIKEWGAYHDDWGYAKGRFADYTWPSKGGAEEWIATNVCSDGRYRPLPYIRTKDLIKQIYG